MWSLASAKSRASPLSNLRLIISAFWSPSMPRVTGGTVPIKANHLRLSLWRKMQ